MAVPVESTWPSDVYRADLSTDAGDATATYFVVKAKEPTARMLLAVATATYEAYNSWPSPEWPGNGESLYDHDSPTRGRRVSLQRPNLITPIGLQRWELVFAAWAARENLAVDYCTSVDIHREPDLLSRYQLLLSVGHDEYWSKEMRDNVEAFIADGGNVAFFSGNTCMWQIRFEDEDNAIVCYRDCLEDPLTGIDDQRVTTEWYSAPVHRPTNFLTGVGFQRGAGFGWGLAPSAQQEDAAYQVCFPEHWVFENAKLAPDHTFGRGENIVGYETDSAEYLTVDGIPRATGRDGTPGNFVILASADLTSWHGSGVGGHATMGLYRRNGTVFTAATVDWVRGLEIDGSAVPQITSNVVRRLQHPIPSDEWELIGTAPRLRSMTRFERNLFGLGEDGRLWYREAAAQNIPWQEAGDGEGISVLGSTEFWSGKLIGVRRGSLVWRSGHPGDDEWRDFGDMPADACGGLAGTNKSVFAVANRRLWSRTAALEPAEWRHIGAGAGIRSLAAWWGKLLALTSDGALKWCFADTVGPVTWRNLGKAPNGALALTTLDGRIIVASDQLLWWRDAA